jgi:4-hydroxybenzoate polyprenyltransferase
MATEGDSVTPLVQQPAKLRDYIAIMRLDHVTKQIFILPGIVLAVLLRRPYIEISVWPIIAGIVVAVSIASANYAINEFLDRGFDAHHPTKAARAAVRNRMSGWIVAAQWAALVALGLGLAASVSLSMLIAAVLFASQGIIYNVPPIRSKDIAYLDVISESVNNPLRLLIGWAMVDSHTLPPSSVIIAYWLGGAFLMASKRLSEYREIVSSHGRELLTRYRRSFVGYDETSLTASCLVYALLSGMTLAVFFVKYRIEYIVTLPALALLFGKYMAMSMHAGSTAQKPEQLFAEKGLMWIVLLVVASFAIFTFVNVPALEPLASQHFIVLP